MQNDQGRPRLNILLGSGSDVLDKVFGQFLSRRFQDTHAVRITIVSPYTAKEIFRADDAAEFDLFLLVINYIISPKSIFREKSAGHEEALDLIRILKEKHQKPLIGLYLYDSRDPDLKKKILEAGADFCFSMPFDLEELQRAVSECFMTSA